MDSVVVSQQGVNIAYQTKYGQLRQVNFLCITVRRLISYASALYLYPHFGNIRRAISLVEHLISKLKIILISLFITGKTMKKCIRPKMGPKKLQ